MVDQLADFAIKYWVALLTLFAYPAAKKIKSWFQNYSELNRRVESLESKVVDLDTRMESSFEKVNSNLLEMKKILYEVRQTTAVNEAKIEAVKDK